MQVGMMALRDIGVGEEVVHDYNERSEPWMKCRVSVIKVEEKVVGKMMRRGPRNQSDISTYVQTFCNHFYFDSVETHLGNTAA